DWAFPGGTPATQNDSKGPISVTYSSAGSKTATLTVSGASTESPANGSYPITVQAVAGVAPMMMAMAPLPGGEGGGGDDMSQAASYSGSTEAPEAPPEEPQAPEEPAPETPSEPEAYDPGAHTVAEVQQYAADKSDEEVRAILDAEIAGK